MASSRILPKARRRKGESPGPNTSPGKGQESGLLDEAPGCLPPVLAGKRVAHPGEEGAARREAEGVPLPDKGGAEQVVTARHHPPVVRHPAVQVFDSVLDRQLGHPRLADRHRVLGLQGLVDELLRSGQQPRPVAGQGIGLAERHDMDEVVPPPVPGKELVRSHPAGNEIRVGLVQQQGDPVARRQPLQAVDGFRRRDHAGRIAWGDQENGTGAGR